MYLAIETVVLCLVFWLFCFLGTGGDKKNMSSYGVFSKELKDLINERDDLKPYIRQSKWYISFATNVVIFMIIEFVCGVWTRQDTFLANFVMLLIMGEVLNAFDFLVMDMLWWRNARRVRLSGTEDKPELYKAVMPHFYSFLRGIPCFLIVALIDGGLFLLF